MLMLNTKVGVASLAFFAVCGLSLAANDDSNKKRAVKRNLRKIKRKQSNKYRRLATNRKDKASNNNGDITEDVAFWTRMMQGSMPAPSPSPPIPS